MAAGSRKRSPRNRAPRKTATRKSTPRKAVPRKASVTKASKGTQTSMSAAHKQALASGREESRSVRLYLEALEAHKPKRGRKRTADGMKARLQQIEGRLPDADALARVHLVQERLNLQSELESRGETIDLKSLEDSFVKAAGGYARRKGLSYAAWRAVGVDPNVLRRAGIPRTRGS
jgi:hypothetical protein